MTRKKLGLLLIFIIFFIFFEHYLAMKFYWYSSIWYFDMLEHFLGGFWIILAYFYFGNFQELSFQTIFKFIFFLFFIAIIWEIFEIFTNDVIARNPFNILDTLSDIFFDLAGGFLSIFYLSKRIMPPEGNKL